VNIDGVPETISRRAACALIESLGLDVLDLISLQFHGQGIEIEMYACLEKQPGKPGTRYFNGEDIAKHKISIPIVTEDGKCEQCGRGILDRECTHVQTRTHGAVA
jgi:hypothetical protein